MKFIDTDRTDIFAHAADDDAGPASLPFDPEDYRAEVNAFDLTEAQKQELLWTLWSIMRSFVELGFTTDISTLFLPDGSATSESSAGDGTIPPHEELS